MSRAFQIVGVDIMDLPMCDSVPGLPNQVAHGISYTRPESDSYCPDFSG